MGPSFLSGPGNPCHRSHRGRTGQAERLAGRPLRCPAALRSRRLPASDRRVLDDRLRTAVPRRRSDLAHGGLEGQAQSLADARSARRMAATRSTPICLLSRATTASIRTSASRKTPAICRSSPPISAAVSPKRRFSFSASSACCGCSRRKWSSISRAGSLRFQVTWSGAPWPMPLPARGLPGASDVLSSTSMRAITPAKLNFASRWCVSSSTPSPISLYRGEADERASLDTILASVLDGHAKSGRRGGAAHLDNVGPWLARHHLAPFLMAAPGYFGGKLTLGSLDYRGRRLQPGAELAAVVRRQLLPDRRLARHALSRGGHARDLALFRTASTRPTGGSTFSDNPEGKLTLEEVETYLPESMADCAFLEETKVELAPGDHVLVTGETAAGKTTFFLAMAGLWSWGQRQDQLASSQRHDVSAAAALFAAGLAV